MTADLKLVLQNLSPGAMNAFYLMLRLWISVTLNWYLKTSIVLLIYKLVLLDNTYWKRLCCCEGLGAGGEGDDRGWDGWMASLTRWMWVWVNYGVGDGQGGLACCSSWGHKESDMTERLNWTELMTLQNQ